MQRHPPSAESIDLTGIWRAHPREPDLVKEFVENSFADDGWDPVTVPHHWRTEPAFADSDGPLCYRTRFAAPTNSGSDRRWFLECDGIFYYGDVWLDGEYLGATEGYFVPHAFEVGDALRARSEHVLALEVACPPQRDRGAQRALTGCYWRSPQLDPDLNPGGIWRPVRLRATGPVRVAEMRTLCIEASVERGRIACALTLDAGADARDARLHAVIRDPLGVPLLDAWRATALAAGTNELTWTLTVDDPPRWWPRTFGPQPMCELIVEVEVDGDVSDGRSVRTAFRDVRRRSAQLTVNGERVFAKGACYGPTRPLLGEADAETVRADLALAVDAHLDLLRVHTHVASPALYDGADELGLLLWQDFPMTGGYARGVRKQAVRQARALVELLGHHPSVALWCAHDAPLGDDTPGRLVANVAAPTWGKEVLDRSTMRAFMRHDPTRPVVRSSGAGDDAHLWFGWRHGDLAGLGPALRVIPRLGRFVSAFGAQAVPTTAAWLHPQQWPHLEWESLAAHHGMEAAAFENVAPIADAKSFDEWRDASQAYQAALLQLQIEDLRRCKGAPSGGFAFYTLVDSGPTIGFGVVDHARVPKRAYAAVRDACRPVLPMVDPRTGNVHVVNDTRTPFDSMTIEIAIDGRVRRWSGDIGGDTVAFVGHAELDDAVDVEVVLTHPQCGRIVNRYPLVVLESGRTNR